MYWCLSSLETKTRLTKIFIQETPLYRSQWDPLSQFMVKIWIIFIPVVQSTNHDAMETIFDITYFCNWFCLNSIILNFKYRLISRLIWESTPNFNTKFTLMALKLVNLLIPAFLFFCSHLIVFEDFILLILFSIDFAVSPSNLSNLPKKSTNHK